MRPPLQRGQECREMAVFGGFGGFLSTWGEGLLPFCPGILLLALDLGGSFHWQHPLWPQNHTERNQTTGIRGREASFNGSRVDVWYLRNTVSPGEVLNPSHPQNHSFWWTGWNDQYLSGWNQFPEANLCGQKWTIGFSPHWDLMYFNFQHLSPLKTFT